MFDECRDEVLSGLLTIADDVDAAAGLLMGGDPQRILLALGQRIPWRFKATRAFPAVRATTALASCRRLRWGEALAYSSELRRSLHEDRDVGGKLFERRSVRLHEVFLGELALLGRQLAPLDAIVINERLEKSCESSDGR